MRGLRAAAQGGRWLEHAFIMDSFTNPALFITREGLTCEVPDTSFSSSGTILSILHCIGLQKNLHCEGRRPEHVSRSQVSSNPGTCRSWKDAASRTPRPKPKQVGRPEHASITDHSRNHILYRGPEELAMRGPGPEHFSFRGRNVWDGFTCEGCRAEHNTSSESGRLGGGSWFLIQWKLCKFAAMNSEKNLGQMRSRCIW